MNLFVRTLKSFSTKERWVAGAFLLVFVGTLFSLIFQTLLDFNPGQSKTYTEGIVGEITHLNPVFTEFSEADADISSLIFSGLVKYNPQKASFDEDMATHTLSEDKLTYTFTLKNNLFWHDGTPVSTDDVYFTFAEVIQSPDFSNTLLKSNFDGVKIEASNSRTVAFTLNSPNSFFFTSLTVGLLPKHLLGGIPVADLDEDEFNKFPIGTGPYKVEEAYTLNEDGSSTVTLTANEDYYGDTASLKKIRFVAYPTITDLIENRSTWHGAARIKASSLEEMDLTDLTPYEYELPQYTALFFNTDAPFLTRNKERLGLAKAIDKEAIITAIGGGAQIDTPLLELDQEEWINKWNKEEAMGALFDAGWEWTEGDEFRSNEEGTVLSLRLLRRDFSTTNPPQEEVTEKTAELIKEQLASVGIQVQIEAYPMEELSQKILARDYDMLLYGQSLGYNLDTFAYWHSSQATETGFNLSNYQNPSADLLIEKIRGSFDSSEREDLLKKLASTIAEDIPAVFLYSPTFYYVVDSKVTGIEYRKLLLPKDRLVNITEWDFN
ncbi:peptide ABC transporter substrate-binding protein [Candidatus Peregrinibacteria bacterium]|nr:MAG: peptide ABC transporter substrate-binding protein [Candidatus Peregrinibacteria bacterium]